MKAHLLQEKVDSCVRARRIRGRPTRARVRRVFGSATLMNRIYERISNYRFKRSALDRVCGKPIRTTAR